jgi:TatD DNase family protein
MSINLDYFYTIDIGCNFSGKQYKDINKLDKIIKDANELGVTNMITISNGPSEWNSNINITKKYPFIYHTIGCHPHDAKSMINNNLWNELERQALTDKCVAIGECGLDYNRMFSPMEKQKEVFERQIEIAKKLNKPLYLHCRDAFDDFIEIIKKHNYYNGVMHCFTGNAVQAKELIGLGFYFGITGWLCDKRRNHDLIDAIKIIPLNKILVETDAPWLSIIPKRESVPQDTGEIVLKIAELKKMDEIKVGHQIYENTKKFFSIY